MITLTDLPLLNAGLNTTSALLLILGYRAIHLGDVRTHRLYMLSASAVSGLFLVSYLVYHYQAGSVRFTGSGWVRPVYFSVLISHVVLAALILPMALVTLGRALRGRFESHRRIARWTLPVWLYVSVTGVIVYLMLYALYPPGS